MLGETDEFTLAGIVRRVQSLGGPPPSPWRHLPFVDHISELGLIDAALVCVPPELTAGVGHDLLQQGVSLVECSALTEGERAGLRLSFDRIAKRHKAAAIVGAGWEPGAIDLFRGLFELLAPHGHTELRHRPGAGLHHTEAARDVAGVRDALSTELPNADGRLQRYLYVELAPDARPHAVEATLRDDPLFAGEETLVFPVESIAALETEGGLLMERLGGNGDEHLHFLLEARFPLPRLAARVMLAAARVLPMRRPGAYELSGIPPAELFAGPHERAARSAHMPTV